MPWKVKKSFQYFCTMKAKKTQKKPTPKLAYSTYQITDLIRNNTNNHKFPSHNKYLPAYTLGYSMVCLLLLYLECNRCNRFDCSRCIIIGFICFVFFLFFFCLSGTSSSSTAVSVVTLNPFFASSSTFLDYFFAHGWGISIEWFIFSIKDILSRYTQKCRRNYLDVFVVESDYEWHKIYSCRDICPHPVW